MIMFQVPENNETASEENQAKEDEWHSKYGVKSLLNITLYN